MNLKVKFYGLLTAILMPFLLFVQMCDSKHDTKIEKTAITEVQAHVNINVEVE